MIQNLAPEERKAPFARAVAADAERRKSETESAIAALDSGVLPTPDDVAALLTWRVGADRQSIMRHHAHWPEHRMREGFEALISAALAAHIDLSRCEAALTAYGHFRDPYEDHVDHTVANPAQKEVMAFGAAYFGTVDTLRRLKKRRTDIAAEIDAIRLKITDGAHYRFILELRRNLSHGSVTVPGWTISTDFTNTTGAMVFDVADLLAFGSWGEEVRAYLASAPEGRLHISAVTAECAKGLAKLRRELRGLFYRTRTAAEVDYFRLQDLHRRTGSRQWMKVFLQGHVEKGTDPYPHLFRFFEPDEVREILRRRDHSTEQVDYIIALRAAQTDCDVDLRSMLYRLFGVAIDGAAR